MITKARKLSQSTTLNQKMLIASITVGLLVWGTLDYLQTWNLEEIFNHELQARLAKQAAMNRLHFDRYLAAHRQAALIFISLEKFSEYLKKAQWDKEQPINVIKYSTIPPWLPSRSIMRSFIHCRYILLLDGDGAVREYYQDWHESIPPSLLKPAVLIRQLSHNQTFMTNVDGAPFLLTTATLNNENGQPLSSLIIANPIDNYFLSDSAEDVPIDKNVIALLTQADSRVIASSDPETIEKGAKLEVVSKDFFLTGKSFFDYSSSDLLLQFTSFIPKTTYQNAVKRIIFTTRIHRAITAASLIALSFFLFLVITRRLKELTARVTLLSVDLNIQPLAQVQGDEVSILTQHFIHIEKELIESRQALIKETETQRKLFHAVEQSPVSIVITDKNGVIEYVNRQFIQLSGFAFDEVIGKTPNVCKSDAHTPAFYKVLWDTIVAGNQWTGEIKNKSKGGAYFWEHVLISPVKDAQGEITHFIGIKQDITEKKQTEEALAKYEEELQAVYDGMVDGVMIVDIQSKQISRVNAAVCKLLGFSENELLKLSIDGIYSKTLTTRQTDFIERAVQRNLPITENVPIFRKEGAIVYVDAAHKQVVFRGKPSLVVFFRDITERKEQQETLRFQAQLLDSVRESIIATDLKGNIIYWGKGAEKLYGYLAEEVISRPHAHFIQPFVRTESKRGFREFIEQGAWSCQSLQRKNDGSTFWVETVISTVSDNRGLPCGAISIDRDVTERKRMEEELKHRKNSLDEAQRIAQIGDWQWDIVNNEMRWSDEVFRMFGLTNREHLRSYQDFLNYVHPDDRDIVQTAVNKSLIENIPYSIHHRIVLPGGAERFVHEKAEAHRDSQGNPILMIGTVQDITAMKQTEEELRKHRDRLEEMVQERTIELKEKEKILASVIEMAGAVIIFLSLEYNVIEFNREAQSIYGINKSELIGANYLTIFVPSEYQEIMKFELEKVVNGIPVRNCENYIVSRQGLKHILLWNADRIVDDLGKPIGIILSGQNITERKKIEENLKQSLKEKELLLKEIHHRVKNNMQVISSLIGLQSAYISDDRYVEMFNQSQRRIKTMALVHEKLYRSKGVAMIDFKDYATNLAQDLLSASIAESDRISLQIDVEDIFIGIDAAIPCGLIINELITNALKHAFPDAKKGLIRLSITSLDNQGKELEVIIGDNGIGFPQEIDFRNTDSLGLHIVVTLVRQLKGKIELVRSVGTEFKISFIAESRIKQI
jgi:PAS domain S-box-containing protein